MTTATMDLSAPATAEALDYTPEQRIYGWARAHLPPADAGAFAAWCWDGLPRRVDAAATVQDVLAAALREWADHHYADVGGGAALMLQG